MISNRSLIVGAFMVFLVGIFAGYTLTHQSAVVGAVSTAGTTNTSAKYYSISMSLNGTSGTTTSILNSSGYDLAVRATDVMCQGVGTSKTAYTGTGLANLNFKVATSSTNTTTGNVSDINSNYVSNVNISTSTTDDYVSTSTEGVIAGTSRVWPNSTYLIISSNATNTAACDIGFPVMSL